MRAEEVILHTNFKHVVTQVREETHAKDPLLHKYVVVIKDKLSLFKAYEKMPISREVEHKSICHIEAGKKKSGRHQALLYTRDTYET